MEYHIRYTCSGELQQRVVDFITRNAKTYIVAREFASKEHLQCYVTMDITKKTWVNKFNEKFKGMDRRDKYVMLDKGHTKLYVCKDNCILAKRGFTDEDIQNFHTEYHAKNPSTPVLLENEEILISPPESLGGKKKKQKTPTFMMECRNELMDEYPFLEWAKKHKILVYNKVMFKLGEGCRNLDHVILTRMTYGILNSLIKKKKEWYEYWYLKAFGEMYNEGDDDMLLDNEICACCGWSASMLESHIKYGNWHCKYITDKYCLELDEDGEVVFTSK